VTASSVTRREWHPWHRAPNLRGGVPLLDDEDESCAMAEAAMMRVMAVRRNFFIMAGRW